MQRIEGISIGEIEEYLKNVILEDRDEIFNFYIELSAREILPITRRLFEENLSLTHEFKISQLVEKEKRLIIYGEAGSGKTTTLKWLNAACAREYLEGKKEHVPIYVSLDSYVKGSFYNYLKAKAKQKGVSEPDFKKLLEGKTLLLLDGLDLLTYSDNFSPLEEISSFISEYEDCRYIIASRHGPSGSIKSTFAVCELEKLSDEKIRLFIENYVPNKRQAKLLKTRHLNKTNSYPLLRNPFLLQLWTKISITQIEMEGKKRPDQELTPSGFDCIPSNQAELYLAFISDLFRNYRVKENFFRSEDVLFLKISGDIKSSEEINYENRNYENRNYENRNYEKLSAERKDYEKVNAGKTGIENFLMDLAFKLQCRNRVSCKYRCALEVAEECAKHNVPGRTEAKKTQARKLLKVCFGLGLLTRNRSEVRFGINQSFQEYFAALKLKAYLENGMDISGAFRHPRWENVVIFTSEMVESGDKLVDSIISSNNLDLASKCAGKASPETKEKLCSLFATRLDSRYTVEKMRAIQSLGRLGICGIEASSKGLEDKDIGVKREAVKALGKTKSEIALAPLTAALGNEDYSVRIEAVKALSMIGSKKAVELLKNALADRNRAVRLEATNALMQIGSESALEVLVSALGAKDDFVRFGAIGALGRASPQKAADPLIKAFHKEDKLVRLGAAEALGQMGSERAVESFIAALQDEDEFVRWIATKALGKIKSDRTPETFIDILGDKSRFVRREAAKALGTAGSEKTLDPLVSALSDEDEFVRKAAAEALGEIGSEMIESEMLGSEMSRSEMKGSEMKGSEVIGSEVIGSETAVEALVSMLSDESHFVRLEAAKALGMVRFRKAVTPLLSVLGDENRFVRKEAAKALGQMEPERVLELLIHALESGNNFMRQGAVRALGQINSDVINTDEALNQIADKVFDFLDDAFQDENKFVRREAARSLENISRNMPERALKSLINALDDEDEEVRRLLAGVLKCLGSEKAVPQLISALKSHDPIVRRFAAEALGQTKSEKALEPLIDAMLFDTEGFVKGEAARALGKVKSRRAIEPLIDALLDENNEGRWGAAEALGRIKAETAVEPLILALADRDDFTRLAAAKALGRIKAKKAIEPLINTLYDWNRFVKAEASGALMKICTEADRERMQALLDSENGLIADLAFEILEEIEMEEISKTMLFSDLQ
ncbi:HEAT repeat domain-containing protein [Methanosarcina sp.]|uniref:HEAT repeat domain-containing protein n=1 Tax=Methanosarcina sp. TaxID=2213 RepID=UPI002AB9B3C0|nr:HEAT repeat domain-containing protein [Methanosarcina sp.]MDY9925925.1 HEAT repeat domain-containing protein [Methanosarcina sp.]